MYNSFCTVRTAAVLTLCKTLCRFISVSAVRCIAITYSLHIEHNLLQTGSCWEETQEHVRTDRMTFLDDLTWSAHIFATLCLIIAKICVCRKWAFWVCPKTLILKVRYHYEFKLIPDPNLFFEPLKKSWSESNSDTNMTSFLSQSIYEAGNFIIAVIFTFS